MISKLSMIVTATLLALLVGPGPVRAQDEAQTCEDARCLFQQEITDRCSCDDVRNHGQYVKCVGKVIRELTAANPQFKNCRGKLVRCAARSTCGKEGFVTCNRVELGVCEPVLLVCSEPVGQVCATNGDCVISSRCSTKRSAESCTDRGGIVGDTPTCCSKCEVAPPTTTPPTPPTTIP